MRKAVLAVIGLTAVAALMAPALGLGSADGRKVLDAKVLGAVSEPYTGATNAIRGVPGGGLPWVIGDASADLRADGRLHVEVEGLVLARRAPVSASLQGTNPVAQFGAIVSCLTTVGGAATTANLATALGAGEQRRRCQAGHDGQPAVALLRADRLRDDAGWRLARRQRALGTRSAPRAAERRELVLRRSAARRRRVPGGAADQ